jgi:putative DNA primase/helicase
MNDSANMDNILLLAEMTKQKRAVVTEDSIALAFAERYQSQFLFDHNAKAWYRWDGNHWKRECTKLAFDWARNLVRELSENESVKVKGITADSGQIDT